MATSACSARTGRCAYADVGMNRIGIFAVPSGRLLSTFPVALNGAAGEMEARPWQFDPAGHLVVYAVPPGNVVALPTAVSACWTSPPTG